MTNKSMLIFISFGQICLFYPLFLGHYEQYFIFKPINHRILIDKMKTKKDNRINLFDYFANPDSQRQKQYEAVRAVIMEKQTPEATAEKFGYKVTTIYAMVRDAKAGKKKLFPSVKKGPGQRRTPLEVRKKIIKLRRKNLSTPDIQHKLEKKGIACSARTVERILKDAGFGKLKRRTNKQLGKNHAKKILPERSAHLDFATLEPFNVDCPSVGVFFFLPYILESGMLDVLNGCQLPESKDIGATQACLSMLPLKLIGCNRLSHIGAYDQEPGLGVFAGLNVLPKPSYMNNYSCGCSETQVMELQTAAMTTLEKKYPDFYESDFINLDFHSIPHYGDESSMEKVWCGARGKTMKGANTVFAQDSESNTILYTRADILRKEEAQEVKKFVTYWKGIKGDIEETLVFDCKFTTYEVMDELAEDKVKFITLRKRNQKLVQATEALSKENWKKVNLSIPKRKYKRVSVYESEVKFDKCKNTFRQIAIKDHGRIKPTFIITNNYELSLKKILTVYAQRWRVENKLSELVAFFNLNALSSPVMIRIHFDVLFTVIADTLYHRFALDLRRHEKDLSPRLFRKFVDMPGRVVYDGNKFMIKIRKRANTPTLKEVEKLQKPIRVPWLSGKEIEIIWTA